MILHNFVAVELAPSSMYDSNKCFRILVLVTLFEKSRIWAGREMAVLLNPSWSEGLSMCSLQFTGAAHLYGTSLFRIKLIGHCHVGM